MVDFAKDDEEKIGSEKLILKQFDPDEKVIFSTKILKFNDEQKKQERIFVITNKHVHNIKKTDIKRSIKLKRIRAMTVSGMSNEFVIHVVGEYDYRYSHTSNREKIINLLNQAHQSLYGGNSITIFSVDSINLTKFTTRKVDQKKGISRLPGKIEEKNEGLSKSLVKDGIGFILAQSQELNKEKEKEITLEDFSLLKELGKGGFGTVSLVKKKDTGQLLALKTIKKSEIDAKNQWEHTKTERMVLEKIRHPFLVSLEFCFENDKKVYFAMQYMQGGELFKILEKEKRFTEARAKFYVAQIALALAHLHANAIIHRDMKPENVLMDEHGYVSLADFGMAKVLKGDIPAISFVGTREYLAPEIITEEGHGKEADWWGLGIFTYELMAGYTPFHHENENEMFYMIKHRNVEFGTNLGISSEAKDFIEKCLKKNQKQRLGSQNDFEDVKNHPWFADINWLDLLNRKVEPPFKPKPRADISFESMNEQAAKERTLNVLSGGFKKDS